MFDSPIPGHVYIITRIYVLHRYAECGHVNFDVVADVSQTSALI